MPLRSLEVMPIVQIERHEQTILIATVAKSLKTDGPTFVTNNIGTTDANKATGMIR